MYKYKMYNMYCNITTLLKLGISNYFYLFFFTFMALTRARFTGERTLCVCTVYVLFHPFFFLA